jgi:hypothetical protein
MLPAAKDLTTFGKEVDTVLMGPAEREKEVLVVLRRSRNADYAEKQGSSYLEVFKMQYYDQVFTPCHPSPEVFIFSFLGNHQKIVVRRMPNAKFWCFLPNSSAKNSNVTVTGTQSVQFRTVTRHLNTRS